MRKLYAIKWINRPEMKFYLVLDYTLPSTWPKFTQVEIQNDRGNLGLVMSLKLLSHLIKRESLMFSLKQYCLDFPIFTMIESKFHFSPTFTSNIFFWTRNTNDIYIYKTSSNHRLKKCIRVLVGWNSNFWSFALRRHAYGLFLLKQTPYFRSLVTAKHEAEW